MWNNDREMYSTHNAGKSVIAKRFIRTLKIKIYKYTTSISKNVFIDKLDDLINKYNNTYHGTIKVKPVDVKPSTHIDSSKESNEKDPKFEIGDIVRVSKYKNVFSKGYTPSWSEEVFVIKKIKISLMILMAKKLLEIVEKAEYEVNNINTIDTDTDLAKKLSVTKTLIKLKVNK